MDGGLSRAADLLSAGGQDPRRTSRRVRRRARQPEPWHGTARHRQAGAARGRHRAPPHHPGPCARRRGGQVVAKAVGAQVVWLRRDAEGSGPPDSGAADRVHHLEYRHRRGLRRVARSAARRAARRRHRVVPARREPRAQPDHRDRQCGRAAEGRQPPAARRRPTARRARSRRAARLEARAQRADGEADRRAGHLRHRAQLQRHQRRRARAPAGVGRGGLHPVAVRGLLAARRRGDGQRDARSWPAARARCPRWSAPTASAPGWCVPPTSTT